VAEALVVDDFVEVEYADGYAVDAGCGGDLLECGRERCERGVWGLASHDEVIRI
jgi:hypothetical protein